MDGVGGAEETSVEARECWWLARGWMRGWVRTPSSVGGRVERWGWREFFGSKLSKMKMSVEKRGWLELPLHYSIESGGA
jgi:hypothetical protein